jgi:hypothetical protein
VRRHIDELAAQGIAPPPQVPILYAGAADRIQVDGHLAASPGVSSGEVEFVLLVTAGQTFVGIGSDHTDRDLEQTSIEDAKQTSPKILSAQVWPLDDLLPTWDSLGLESWLSQGPDRHLYQQGSLASVMTPADLLALVPEAERGAGLVLYSGTFAAENPAPRAGQWTFEGTLTRPDGTILCQISYTYEAGPR